MYVMSKSYKSSEPVQRCKMSDTLHNLIIQCVGCQALQIVVTSQSSYNVERIQVFKS